MRLLRKKKDSRWLTKNVSCIYISTLYFYSLLISNILISSFRCSYQNLNIYSSMAIFSILWKLFSQCCLTLNGLIVAHGINIAAKTANGYFVEMIVLHHLQRCLLVHQKRHFLYVMRPTQTAMSQQWGGGGISAHTESSLRTPVIVPQWELLRMGTQPRFNHLFPQKWATLDIQAATSLNT